VSKSVGQRSRSGPHPLLARELPSVPRANGSGFPSSYVQPGRQWRGSSARAPGMFVPRAGPNRSQGMATPPAASSKRAPAALCPSPCGFHRKRQRSDLVKPQDGSPISRFRRPLRRLKRARLTRLRGRACPQSLVLVLCALRVCAPNQGRVKNSSSTVLRHTNGAGAESSP
jgi:hypothetical protein